VSVSSEKGIKTNKLYIIGVLQTGSAQAIIAAGESENAGLIVQKSPLHSK